MVKLTINICAALLIVFSVSHAPISANEKVKLNTLADDIIPSREAILIQNAKIHTLGSQGTLENGSILIEDGKISMIGIGIPGPQGTKIINAEGRDVTPGLMNAQTSLGLVEVNAIDTTVDRGANARNYAASFSIASAINPNSTLIPHNRINGLTRAMVVPSGDKALFQGKGSLIKLSLGMEPLVSRDNAVYLTYGEQGADIAGGSRALAMAQIREIFDDVKRYTDNPGETEAEYSLKKRELKALLPVVKGDIPLVVSVHRASDILAMIELKASYSLKMILSGVEEGWMVAAKIAAAEIPVVVDPYRNLPGRFETIASRIDNATLLHQANVELIIANLDFIGSHNAYLVRQSAGNAVAFGLPWDIALAAITTTPAKCFGIGNTFGTLEAGMDADLVIWDGDPLEVTTSADQVFIQGREMPMVSRQTRLRDRYMNKTGRPAAYSR